MDISSCSSSSGTDSDDETLTVGMSMKLISAAVAASISRKRLKIDHRLLPRKEKRKFRHQHAYDCIMYDYLGPDPLFGKEFDLMFRVSRRRMQRLLEDFGNSDLPFYSNAKDCFSNDIPSLEARLLLPLKCMAYGVPPHTFMDYFSMSMTCARTCYLEFARGSRLLYLQEYLGKPTKADIRAIMKLHKAIHRGVNGILGSLDCMHTYWNKCPVAWKGQYKKGKAKPSIVLEGMCDYHLYFWHASFGYAGTLNDVNILNLSPLTDMFLNGEMQELEDEVTPFDIGGEEFKQLFILVDGIYPKYSRFVKAYKEPVGDDEKALTSWQESARKDIERAFGVLQAKFQVLARPLVIRSLKVIEEIVTCCLILHNMCVADRVMDGDPRAKYDPMNSLVSDEDVQFSAEYQDLQESGKGTRSKNTSACIGVANAEETVRALISRRRRWMTLIDKKEYARLHLALKNFLGAQYRHEKTKKKGAKK